MSLARKCDRCGALFDEAAGQLSIEALHVSIKKEKGSWFSDSWSEIDFCNACSDEVLAAIGAAIQS